jgi:hypothetical protein
MNSTRDNNQTKIGRAASAVVLLAGTTLAATNALAEQVSIQFSQSYPGGGTVTGLLVGEDLDGDGRLYSVSPALADALGLEAGGEEVTYASVRIDGVLGEPVVNVFDASVAPISDESNFFWGFAYNLDGGELGDEENEGVSFAPLAPSTSYVGGPLFAPAFTPSVIPDEIGPCGSAEGIACSALITLDPVDPFPNFELLFSATSTSPIVSHELLRYTFEQSGFDGGASITGTVSGRDLDGDGQIYSAGLAWTDMVGLPAGDEVAYASVTIRGMEPLAVVNIVDLVATDVTDIENFFFSAAVNVAGAQLGDEEGEGIAIAPFSPSTSYVVGEIYAPFFGGISEQTIGNCGNEDGLPCGGLIALTPNPDVASGVDTQAEQFSSAPTALAPAPFIVDATFSGTWFNTVPNGEGMTIQIIEDGRVVLYWMTYDEIGNQRWLFGVGNREGLKIQIDDLLVTEGGLFGTISPVEVEPESVGEVTIEFSDCDTAVMNWTVDGVPGTMEIGRLAGLSNLECIR